MAPADGLDISFAVAGWRVRTRPPDNFGLFVRDTDLIRGRRTWRARESRSAHPRVSYIHTAAWLRKNGVEPKSMRFLALPLPQMIDALLSDRVDAGWVVEPLLTFERAVDRATAFLNDGPREERNAWIAGFTGVRAELVEHISLPPFTDELNVESQGLMKPFDVKTLV